MRSSATAEDLPNASFAGQQETFLNVVGEAALLDACRHCYASLFTDRAISYRDMQGFDHLKVALSIGVQAMVRADLGGSGIMFSIDTESGFPGVVVISAAWGLGEPIVQGAVDPDRYLVFKPPLGDPRRVPILEKALGGKARKMVHASGGTARTALVDTTRREREAFVLQDAGDPATGPLGGGGRAALRPADGPGMGARRRDGRAVHRPGAAGDGAWHAAAPRCCAAGGCRRRASRS